MHLVSAPAVIGQRTFQIVTVLVKSSENVPRLTLLHTKAYQTLLDLYISNKARALQSRARNGKEELHMTNTRAWDVVLVLYATVELQNMILPVLQFPSKPAQAHPTNVSQQHREDKPF